MLKDLCSLDQPQTRKAFVRISLAANIVILIAVCTVLIAFGTSEPVVYAWGTPTAGRGILLSIYFAILIMSILLFAMHYRSPSNAAVQYMVAALLATQIMYKVSTPITTALVREPSSAAGGANPVAISNLCISGLHAVTLFLLWRWHCATDPTASSCACGRQAVVPVAVVPEATRLACSRCSRARLLSVIHTSHVRGRDVKVKPVCPLLHSASLRHRRDRRRYQAFCQGLTPRSTKEPRWAYGEGPRGPRRRACARAGIHIHQSMPYGLRSFNRLSFVGGRSAGGARARARQTPYTGTGAKA